MACLIYRVGSLVFRDRDLMACLIYRVGSLEFRDRDLMACLIYRVGSLGLILKTRLSCVAREGSVLAGQTHRNDMSAYALYRGTASRQPVRDAVASPSMR